jgi:Sec7-like guanine-nucleotide exchange factor
MSPRRRNTPAATKPINYYALRFLEKANPKLRRNFIKTTADNGVIDAISECCKNVLNKKKAAPALVKKMQPNRLHIRKIADKKTPTNKRRKLLVQHGGFLQYLLPLALSTLTSIFAPKN